MIPGLLKEIKDRGYLLALALSTTFHFDRTLADYSMYEFSEVLTILDQLAAVNQQ